MTEKEIVAAIWLCIGLFEGFLLGFFVALTIEMYRLKQQEGTHGQAERD